MRKIKIAVSALLIAGSALLYTSCIGSFGMTKSVMKWNKSIGSKFVNELVFIAFWILPVYEVTAWADVLVVNSIEFWSGSNPMEASTKVIDSEHGRYLIACDGKGYTVTHEASGESLRLDFDEPTQTWSYKTAEGEDIPFMTFIDSDHVKMLTPGGEMMAVELSEEGIADYERQIGVMPMAYNR